MIEKYVGFFTPRPFWAIDAIDFQDATSGTLQRFHPLMSEVTYQFTSGSFSFRVCRDGMILLQIYEIENRIRDDIHDLVEWWGEYLDYLNCLYLLLDSEFINVSNIQYFMFAELRRNDVFRVTFEDNQETGMSIATESITGIYQSIHHSRFVDGLPIGYDPRTQNRVVIPKQVFDNLTEKFEFLISDKNLVSLLSGLSKSLSEFKIGNYTTSLTLAWFVIESILIKKWGELLDAKNITYADNSRRVNTDRKKFLMRSDISVVANLLELTDNIDFSLFKKIDEIRDYRNKIIHQNPDYICKFEHCTLALGTALERLLEKAPFSIIVPLSIQLSGA